MLDSGLRRVNDGSAPDQPKQPVNCLLEDHRQLVPAALNPEILPDDFAWGKHNLSTFPQIKPSLGLKVQHPRTRCT